MAPLSNIKFYYFEFPGRGAFLRLLLEDAQIKYEHIKIPLTDWLKVKADLTNSGMPVPTLPYITIDGRYMGKTTPTMRYISKQIGKYMSDNELDNHDLESLADLCNDWFNTWVIAHYLSRPNGPSEAIYQASKAPMYHDSIEKVLAKNGGPYVLGEEITYVDFFIYHTMVDDRLRPTLSNTRYPNMKKLAEAMESRTNLQNYFNKE